MKLAPVSVVIPTYNNGGLLTQALDSVLAQTILPAEIVVVDDGSQDDTAQRIVPYAGRVKYLFQPNQGVSAARNRGLDEARQEWIAFLDADDVWHPRKLELQLHTLRRVPDLALLGTEVFDWPATSFPDCDFLPSASLERIPWDRLVVKNYFTTSSVLVRRSVLQQVGFFDTSLQGPEDYDRWLHVAEWGPVANLMVPLTGYRDMGGSLSKQAARMQAGMQRILGKQDERRVWRGRRGLRRKAYSYCNYSCAYMHSTAGNQWTALGQALKSFAWYPLAYRRNEVRMRLARPKLLASIVLRILGAARPESPKPVLGELASAA